MSTTFFGLRATCWGIQKSKAEACGVCHACSLERLSLLCPPGSACCPGSQSYPRLCQYLLCYSTLPQPVSHPAPLRRGNAKMHVHEPTPGPCAFSHPLLWAAVAADESAQQAVSATVSVRDPDLVSVVKESQHVILVLHFKL